MEKNWEELAVEYKRSGLNCAQAVAKALAEKEGLDTEDIVNMMAGFGSGVATMEGTCGALVGAVLIKSLMKKGDRPAINAKGMSNAFKELSGSVICRELKGIETGQVLCACEDCVRNGVKVGLDNI